MRGNLGRSIVPIAFGVACSVAGSAACSGATGEVRGGEERYDAASPAPLVVSVTEPTFADASPTSWKGIYRDFFGRRAKATCAGNGTCHDAAGKGGSKASNFICADVDGCYESLRRAKRPADPGFPTNSLVEDADIANPDNAYLFKVVRIRTAEGELVANGGMPATPVDFYYSAAEISLMKAWIKAGAKND